MNLSPSRLGDQVVSVNGVSLEDVNHSVAVDALKRAGHHVTLVSYSMNIEDLKACGGDHTCVLLKEGG